MVKKITNFLLLLFLGFSSYFIILYLAGLFNESLRPLKHLAENQYHWVGAAMVVLAVIDFFIAKKLFWGKK